jgi:hypothetical protein
MASRKNHKKTLAKKRVHRGGGTRKRGNDDEIINKMKNLIETEKELINLQTEDKYVDYINETKNKDPSPLSFALFIFKLRLRILKKYIKNEIKDTSARKNDIFFNVQDYNIILNNYLELKGFENNYSNDKQRTHLNKMKINELTEFLIDIFLHNEEDLMTPTERI